MLLDTVIIIIIVLRAYSASRLLDILCLWSLLLLPASLCVTGRITIHLTDEKTAVQQGDVTCSESLGF